MKRNAFLFFALLMLLARAFGQIDLQKVRTVRNRIASAQINSKLKSLATMDHLHRYDYWTRRSYNNKNYYTLIRISYNDSLQYLQFSEFPTIGSIRLGQYTYALNKDLELNFAYRMEAGNDSMLFDEYNPLLNKNNKDVQQLFIPKLELTINELYELLTKK